MNEDDLSRLEPDVLELFSRQVIAMAPEFEAAILAAKARLCQQYGGQRYYLPKGAKRLTDAERQAVYQDGLKPDLSDAAITQKHKISSRTFSRIMKSGGGRFS